MKKKATLFNFLILLVPIFSFSQNITHRCDNDKFQYVGRFDKTDPGECISAYPGSEIRFTFQGKKVDVKLVQITNNWANAYYDVRIDGKFSDSLNVNKQNWHNIYAGNLIETHTVSLIRRNEPWAGEVSFQGIELEGQLIESLPLPQARLLFVGASWESGYGNLGNFTYDESLKIAYDGDDNTNNYYSYPAMTARSLAAQYTCVCYGGKGVNRAYDGDTVNQLPAQFYKSTPDSDIKTDMQAFIPEVIVFDLGGNDFATGFPDKYQFVKKYVETIKAARSFYPNAHIILSQLTLDPGSFNKYNRFYQTQNDYITTVYNEIKDKGDVRFYLWKYEEWNIERWGFVTHPNVATYRNVAESLTQFIRTTTGYLTTGIEQYVSASKNASIYPNPVKDELQLPDLTTDYQVYDHQGRMVLKGRGKTVNTSQLVHGLYLIKTNSETESFVKQ